MFIHILIRKSAAKIAKLIESAAIWPHYCGLHFACFLKYMYAILGLLLLLTACHRRQCPLLSKTSKVDHILAIFLWVSRESAKFLSLRINSANPNISRNFFVIHPHFGEIRLVALKPNTYRRRRRDETVELRRVGVGGVYTNSQLTHGDCRRIRWCERSRRPWPSLQFCS